MASDVLKNLKKQTVETRTMLGVIFFQINIKRRRYKNHIHPLALSENAQQGWAY